MAIAVCGPLMYQHYWLPGRLMLELQNRMELLNGARVVETVETV